MLPEEIKTPIEEENEGVIYNYDCFKPKREKRDNSDAYGFQDPGDISFGRAAFEKIVAIMLSVKVHIMVSLLVVSTWLIVNGYIDGGEWTTVNTTIVSIVVGLRETFKLSAINYRKTPKNNKDKFRQ